MTDVGAALIIDPIPRADATWLAARGRIADRLRAGATNETTLGPLDMWPAGLRVAAGMLLEAEAPMLLFWGDGRAALWNDAFDPARTGTGIGELGRPASAALEQVARAARATPVRDPRDGEVAGTLYMPRSEQAQLGQIVEQAPGYMALLREPGHVFEFANAAYQQLIGDRAVVGRAVADALPELASHGLLSLLDRVVAERRSFAGRSMPVAVQRVPDGPAEERLLDVVCQPVIGPDGMVEAIFLQGSDVTDRVQTADALAVSEERFRLAAEVAEIGTWDYDAANDVLLWDARVRRMFGVTGEAEYGVETFYAGLHPDDREATIEAFAAALDPDRRLIYDVEYRAVGRDDGVTRWIAAKGRGIFSDGSCVRAIGTAIDITERRRAQQTLEESEVRFRSLANSAPALIWLCDERANMIFANQWHEETFGQPPETLLGAAWQDFIHPEDISRFDADFSDAFARRGPFSRDVRAIDRHGRVRWLHAEARPRFVEGRFAGYVGCDVDITETHNVAETLERGIAERTGELAASNRMLRAQIEERERVEATLRQMQRLEAIGQLTSGVAHDFNNLLTVILGNLDIVVRAADAGPLDDRAVQRLGHMRSAAERGAALTAQLLAFSRRQRLEPRATDLNETVGGMRELLESSMGGSVQLGTRLQPDLWPALVDPTQIELIILNLAINARDAMAVGGSLDVETGNVTLGVPVQPEEPPAGDYVMIAVSDNGSGMTADVLAKAFEPFFTTKAVGKGSGLGLAQVFGFARQSGGGVRIDTILGRGTTVRVYLPRSREVVAPPAELPPAAPGGGGASGKRVLLVDDDRGVREITASVLRDLGCLVEEADCGAEALASLERSAGGFDLMVLDFAMPGMNGAEVAHASEGRWPALPILFVTGFADLSAIASVSEDRIVQKPYRGAELQRKAMRLLAGAAAAG